MMMSPGEGAVAGRRRRGGGQHRSMDSSMDMDGGAGANPKRRRQRERQNMLLGFEYGPALTVSEENHALGSSVFDMLDKDRNERLDATDFVLAGTVDREVFHRACRPVPQGGLDFHEFLRRCARFNCGETLPNGAVRLPASLGPQSLNLQGVPISQLLILAEQRMNDELHAFFSQWRRALEQTSGVAVAVVQIAPENMVMMCRVYNRLDVSLGDGDGILSANDACWPILAQSGFVASTAQTSLSFDQFREALVKRALENVPFSLDRGSFTMDAAVVYVYQKLNEAILYLLADEAAGLGPKVGDCPSVAEVAPGQCVELDRPPLLAPQPLCTYAFSLSLDVTMLQDLALLYKDLDEDDSGSLEAEDFECGAAMQDLWAQLASLDTDGDGQISMDEWIRGMGTHALSRSAEFSLADYQHSVESPCTLRTFLTGTLDDDGVTMADPRHPNRVSLTEVINERTRELYRQIRVLVPLRHGVSSDAVPL